MLSASDVADPSGEIGNGQRAFWTFLFYTLSGPFFAALTYAAAVILAPPLKLGALLPVAVPPLGEAAVGIFVWTALPAALTAIGVAPMVLRHGTFSWVVGAAAGVIAFAAATAIAPLLPDLALAPLAFFAGLISLTVRLVLLASGILREPTA